jgi:hypothetical protein
MATLNYHDPFLCPRIRKFRSDFARTASGDGDSVPLAHTVD